jgi:hypothetical protein
MLIMVNYEEFIFSLMDEEPAVFGGAIINNKGELAYQTENWEINQDLDQLKVILGGENPGSISIMKIKYMIVEFTPERIIGTNVTRKGHIIIAPVEKGALICYIDPSKGPRDALFNVQDFAGKLKGQV